MKMDAMEFVKVWQTSETLVDAAKKCGVDAKTASVRAARYRKAGVPLKRFDQGARAIDYKALAETARKYAKEAK